MKALPRHQSNTFFELSRYVCCCQKSETHLGLDVKCPIF